LKFYVKASQKALFFLRFSVTFFSHGETIPGEEVTIFMENNIKIASDSLSDAMTVLQLLEVNVEQDEYDPYILRSLRIIDNLLHTAKTALPQSDV
jgi:hypothetical protein